MIMAAVIYEPGAHVAEPTSIYFMTESTESMCWLHGKEFTTMLSFAKIKL